MATSRAFRPPTIHDVARVAKLSKSTVSNVIRNAEGVHPTTRERVRAAIAELGYQTNIVARQLVQQRTTVLGIVIGDLTNPFHAEMAKLIEGLTAAHGYQAMFCSTRADRDVELSDVRCMLEHRVAGLLFLACKDAAQQARHLIPMRVPSVCVACSADGADVVAVDEGAGARAATSHLIEAGHRHIWHLGTGNAARGRTLCERAQGYDAAMRQAGLTPVCFTIGRDGETAIFANAAMPLAEALTGPGAPTAIFAVTDPQALRIIGLAERLGRPVPAALSVVGFDDAFCLGHGRLGLTTIAQPKAELARLAVETLIRRVAGDRPEAPARQFLDFELMVRGSTAPPGRLRMPRQDRCELLSV